VEEAYERLRGQPFAVEVKIDGNRLQVCQLQEKSKRKKAHKVH
jgi:hypothetical protein